MLEKINELILMLHQTDPDVTTMAVTGIIALMFTELLVWIVIFTFLIIAFHYILKFSKTHNESLKERRLQELRDIAGVGKEGPFTDGEMTKLRKFIVDSVNRTPGGNYDS